MKKSLVFSLLLVFSIAPLISFSQSQIPQGSRAFVVVNGNVYLGTPEGIYSLSNSSYILRGYDVVSLAYLNGFYFITSNGSLYFYNGTSPLRINVPYPQRIFVDVYTGDVYVVSDYQYVYVVRGTQVLKSYYVYESFGFLTFTKDYAVVDSQAGFTFLYYNGTNRTVIYYQDALTGMTFGNSTFVVGSFSPDGLWVFTNLSVLRLPVIPVTYFSQLRYYNIVYVPLPFTPYWVYCWDGLIYAVGHEGYAVIYPKNDYQVIFLNRTEVLDSTLYNGTLYLLTPYGIVKEKFYPPPIYVLTIKEVGLPNGSPFVVVINGTKYTTFNGTISLSLAGDAKYNITFLDYLSFRPNVTSMSITLTGNSTIEVGYSTPDVPVKIIVEGINNQTSWTLYVNGKEYSEVGSPVIIYLPNSTSFIINASIPGFEVSPTNLAFITTGNNTIVIKAMPILKSQAASSTGGFTLNLKSFTSSPLDVLSLGVVVLLLVFVVFLLLVVRRR